MGVSDVFGESPKFTEDLVELSVITALRVSFHAQGSPLSLLGCDYLYNLVVLAALSGGAYSFPMLTSERGSSFVQGTHPFLDMLFHVFYCEALSLTPYLVTH